MPIKDRNGCLHSEANGRFISKNDADKLKKLERVYNTHGHLNETEQEFVLFDPNTPIEKNIKFAVNTSKIDSRAYRDKFLSITTDYNLANSFYLMAREILKHRSGQNGEDLYLYDANTDKWVKSVTGKIAFRPEYTSDIENCIRSTPGLIAFHNHAESTPPNASDLNAAFRNKYLKGYVLCHNGKIYEYTRPNSIIDEGAFIRATLNYDFDSPEAKSFFTRYGFYIREVKVNA